MLHASKLNQTTAELEETSALLSQNHTFLVTRNTCDKPLFATKTLSLSPLVKSGSSPLQEGQTDEEKH